MGDVTQALECALSLVAGEQSNTRRNRFQILRNIFNVICDTYSQSLLHYEKMKEPLTRLLNSENSTP